MDIELNTLLYQVNPDEYGTIIHNSFNHLKIRKDLGNHERIVGLLKELAVFSNRCLFFSQSHGGFIGTNCSSNYDAIYFINNSEKHVKNIQENVKRMNLANIRWELDFNYNTLKKGETIVVYSDNYDNIDTTFLTECKPILLTNINKKLINSSLYKYTYELSDTNLILCIPDDLHLQFYKEFHYYIKNGILFYDNLIHLCIMVKNGGEQFEDMLTKNMHLIDKWSILDTGSTDNTLNIIEKVLIGKKKGTLFQEPFINFRDSRNRLLDLAGDSCKYILMLDDTYMINGDLRSFLNEVRGDQVSDSFSLYIKSDDVEYGTNRILQASKKLRYLYKIHEVIQEKNNINIIVPNNISSIFDARFDYMQDRTMNRKELDLKLLYEEVDDDPQNPRTFYYLAQTYNVMENHSLAYEFFLKRMNHPVEGFIQEKIDAIFEAARIANFKINRPWSECEELYFKAYNLDTSRPDSLYFIGIHYYLEKDRKKAYDYFKLAFQVGYPVHCQYSLKPTLSFHFLPKFLTQLCYEYNDYVLGEQCAKLFLEKNEPDADMYDIVVSWYKIFIKLNQMTLPLEVNNKNNDNQFNKKPILCFVADGGFEPWTGSDILTKGVGGSETYIIEMARYIQRQGYFKVIVFCNCLQENTFESVDYIPISQYPPYVAKVFVDTCIISRFSEYVPVAIQGHINKVHLVLHDLTPSGLVIPIHKKLKKIYCLSEWHVGYFLKIFPQLSSITVPFYYGIDNTFKNQITTNKLKNKFIYSSFPNRGLLQLLQMWKPIVTRYPDASLHIFSDVNGKWVNSVEPELMNKIRLLLAQLSDADINIHYHGWVDKKVLAQAWTTSEYWLYPCTFMETFCLTAVEAALSKTLAITNGLAALQNTVGDRGVCIEGDASTSEWQRSALTELFSLMENDERKQSLIEKNYSWASNLSWNNQAIKLLKEHILL